MILLAIDPDPLSGGAGWVGAGLLGLVLCWLLLKHLPEKDRLLLDVLKQYREELKMERDICEKRAQDFLVALGVIKDEIRRLFEHQILHEDQRDSRKPRSLIP